tara:strand:+ start:941 stop:2602 length:1662 start_codon:yes stop_codon:yes gene_type:complete
MALTIGIEGLGVIANADNATTDTASSGSWGFTGSGGVSNGVTTDTFYYGSASIAMALSGSGKNGWLYYQHTSAINFSTTYSGQFIYIWVHCPTLGLTETLANVGLGIRIGTDTSNYRTYTIAGNDDSNGWDGRWKCFVIDPNLTGSIADTGTYSASTITYIGIKGQTTGTAKGDNFFVSQIAVGSGLRITGTSTTGWKEVVDYCVDLTNRAWGMAQEREGIYYAYGDFYIGDTAQTADTSFVDSGRIIQYGVSEYYISSAWATSLIATGFGLDVEDNATWKTTFTDGVIVGTEEGRSGSTFIGGANEEVHMNFYGGNNAGSVTELLGTKFQSISGSFVSGNDADHKFLSCSFIACSQFDPVGAPLIRNCTFAETVDINSALLWNENIDIEDCSFIANTLGAGIEHPSSAGTPYSYTNLLFSGNTFDGLNTSGANITVNKAGTSNPITDEGSFTITYDASITLSITVVDDSTGLVIATNPRVIILKDSDKSELMNQAVNGSGVASTTVNEVAGVSLIGWAREMSLSGTDYHPKDFSGVTTSAGFSAIIRLEPIV